MDEAFCIFVDRLRSGEEENFKEVFSPEFLDIEEDDLSFTKEVDVEGKAYIANSELVIHFDIETEAEVPCAICNQKTPVSICVRQLIHVVPLEEVPSGVYSFASFLRETILLEVPHLVECRGGECPEREEMKKFFHKNQGEEETTYRPFADFPFDEE